MSVRERRDRANAKFVKKSSDVKVTSSSTTRPKNNSGITNSGTSIKQRRDRANNSNKPAQVKQDYTVSNSYYNAYKQYVNSPFNINNIDKTIQETNAIIGFDGKSKEPYKSRVVNWTKPAKEDTPDLKLIEPTPVEESPAQPTVPIDSQDYQLGEYQVDNIIPNSSIRYVMPPIERKSLEMPQHNGEQVSPIKDFLSGISTIPAYVYHNKVVPFIDETREKLFGPSEEELARRAAEEEQDRLRLEEEARIAREQFVQDSIQHDTNQRTEDILARIAAMDTSYVVGRYNGRNLVSGLATPNSRFLGTNRKQKTNVRGYNILAPWNNWAILDENTTDKSIEDNHFIKGNKHERRGGVNPAVARYITITNDGNLMFTDTIPRGIRGQITTGYASTGNLSNSFKKNKSIRNMEVVHPDGTKSYPVFSWLNPYNLNSVYHPVQAAVLFDLPNGEKSWVIPYGRTANQFYNDVSKIKNITGDDELEFVNFDSRSATGAYGDAGIRYNKFGSYPSLILRKKFGGNMRRTLRKGGRIKAGYCEETEEYYPIWLDGITVKPSGNRPTTRDDWSWANWRELQNEREQQAAESVRRGIDKNGTPIAAGIYGLTAAPFAIEGLGSSAVANGVRTGLQAMNTAFTPSTWLNPVTGAKLLSPTVGTIADAGIQGAFAYEGLNGLYNQGREGTLLSDPVSTFMHGLEVLPLVGLGSKAIGSAYRNLANSNIVKNRGFALPINNTLYWVGRGLGSEISLTPGTEGYMRVSDVLSKSPGTGRKLYDAAIKHAQNNGYRGIESGNILLSAPKTYSIWEHYPNRQLLGNYGTHNNFNMVSYGELDNVGSIEDMIANTTNGIPTKFEGAPVYGLIEPSVDIATKARHIYNTPTADIMAVESSNRSVLNSNVKKRLADFWYDVIGPKVGNSMDKLYNYLENNSSYGRGRLKEYLFGTNYIPYASEVNKINDAYERISGGPKYAKDFVNIPEEDIQHMISNTIARNAYEKLKAGYNEEAIKQEALKQANVLRNNTKIAEHSTQEYVDSAHPNSIGLHTKRGDNHYISVRRGSPNQKRTRYHEERHALQDTYERTEEQNNILYNAYGDDFLNLEKYKGYNMLREAETVNLESREELMDRFYYYTDDFLKQNDFIDMASDYQIFRAVEQSNGYGGEYIKYLREHNLLTPEKAQAFREAMKHVGSYVLGVGTAGIVADKYLNQDKNANQQYRNGGRISLETL